MKDTIVCKDSRHLGKSLEILDSIDLRCYQPKFAITDGARGPVISWNGTFDREEPPFSKYMLYYSKVMNIGKFEDFHLSKWGARDGRGGARLLKISDGNLTYNEVELTGQKMNKELFDIQPSSIYRICIYNVYLYTNDFIPGESYS